MHRLRIAYLQDATMSYSPGANGTQKPLGLTRSFSAYIVCPADAVLYREIEEGAQVIRGIHKSGRSLPRRLAPIPENLRLLRRVKLRDGLDAVYTGIHLSGLISGFLARKLLGVKWIADCWDHPYAALAEKGGAAARVILWLRWHVEGWLLRHADLVVLNIHPDVLAPMRLRDGRLLALKNGVLVSRLAKIGQESTPQAALLGVVANVSEAKRGDFALRALAEIRKIIPNARLRLIGEIDAGYAWKLDQTIRHLHLETAIELTGWRPYEEAMRLAAECSILLYCYPDIPRLRWNYVLKIGEYHALRRPVVAVDLPGARALIRHEETGLICDPDSPEDMAKKAITLLQQPDLWAKISSNAASAAKELDWTLILDRINSRIAALLNQ